MNNFLKIFLGVLFLSLSACNDPFGDVLCNGTDQKIRIIATTSSGIKDEYVLDDEDYGTAAGRYQKFEVFTMKGKKIGSFSRNDVPGSRKEYVAPVWVLVTEDGIYPIPDRYKLEWQKISMQSAAQGIEANRKDRLKIQNLNLVEASMDL